MKKVIKPTAIVLFINLGTYIFYLLLLICNIVHCYENVNNEYEENLPIYITYFVTSIVLTFLLALFAKLDKKQIIILLIELFVTDIISINNIGAYYILQSFDLNISDNFIKIFAFIISALLLSTATLAGNKMKIIWQNINYHHKISRNIKGLSQLT